jgi:hypothetical protein
MTEAALDATESSPTRARSARIWRRAGLAVGGFVLLGALAHAPFARSLLARVGGCPMGAPLSASELESKRVEAARKIQGAAAAAARPAFGFALDVDTRTEARAWAAAQGATCNDKLAGAALECARAGDDALDVFFQFDPKGRLVALDVMREHVAPDRAAALVRDEIARLTREAGAPTKAHGETTGAYLAGELHQASAEFRFSDYAADVSATHTLDEGVMVRMQYRSIPKG